MGPSNNGNHQSKEEVRGQIFDFDILFFINNIRQYKRSDPIPLFSTEFPRALMKKVFTLISRCGDGY
jgi:hypothetical protein